MLADTVALISKHERAIKFDIGNNKKANGKFARITFCANKEV
jgi:hypothetical protein